MCYSDCGATSNGRRFAPLSGQLLPLIERKGELLMVTYSDLIQIGILIVGIVGIFMMYKNQK